LGPGRRKFLRRCIFYGKIQKLSFVENENVAVIGGGNSALQILENLHAAARKVHFIFTSEITADATVMERAACIANLQTYIGYKAIQFIGGMALASVPIREMAGAEILDLPAKGVFTDVGLEPNSSLPPPLLKLNSPKEIMISPDCSTSYSRNCCRGRRDRRTAPRQTFPWSRCRPAIVCGCAPARKCRWTGP
jgi:thioredoxin reductase